VATPLSDILTELGQLLEPERFEDYGPNGLQVPPSRPPADTLIETVATGVSAQAELFEKAATEGAQLLLVHHGLFWGDGIQTVDATLRARLKILLDADIALAAYHLPLDAHAKVGNNALLARALGAERLDPFAMHRGEPIGFLADLPGQGLSVEELLGRVRTLTDREPLLLGPGPAGPAIINSLAIVSGAGSDYLEEAAAAGAHALLTGEAAERATATARELGLHLIAAGHYATETFGIRRLGEHLAERFALRHVFIDVPNPV
jgi:dinuclear metal center YbgI/SA1388 family protein